MNGTLSQTLASCRERARPSGASRSAREGGRAQTCVPAERADVQRQHRPSQTRPGSTGLDRATRPPHPERPVAEDDRCPANGQDAAAATTSTPQQTGNDDTSNVVRESAPASIETAPEIPAPSRRPARPARDRPTRPARNTRTSALGRNRPSAAPRRHPGKTTDDDRQSANQLRRHRHQRHVPTRSTRAAGHPAKTERYSAAWATSAHTTDATSQRPPATTLRTANITSVYELRLDAMIKSSYPSARPGQGSVAPGAGRERARRDQKMGASRFGTPRQPPTLKMPCP